MQAHSIPLFKVCEICGVTFTRRKREERLHWEKRRTCGIACGRKLAWHIDPERRARLSEQMKARYASREKACVWCGLIFTPRQNESYTGFWKRETCSKECGVELCMQRRYENRGKGRQTRYPRGFNESLRNQIRERDQWACRLCNAQTTELLSVHHIDYDKNNLSERNLISLCRSCHGKTNYQRDHWQSVFTELMAGIPHISSIS